MNAWTRMMAGGASLAMVAASAQAAPNDPGRAKVVAAIAADKQGSIERLRDWIKLPTVANMNMNHQEGADYMKKLALDAGFQHAEVLPTGGVPGVFATLDAGAKDTLAIYFMYDVKHFDESEWVAPPLEGKIIPRAGEGTQLIGRGAVNQKGPEMAFLTALKAFKDSGVKLPVNLVLVAEGEEEIASTNFHNMLAVPKVQAALAKTVGVMMPFAAQGLDGSTGITLGAKGAVELQLISSGEHWGRGPKKDIHSSLMAVVDNPAWRLVKALDTLVAEDGFTPAVEGWFENVRPLSERQKQIIREGLPPADLRGKMKQGLGIQHWIKDEDDLTSAYRLASQPTINIQGLVAGYTGPGGKTVLPGRAEAKIDLRLVPDMTKDEVVKKLRAHLDKKGFKDIQIVVSGGYGPTQTAEDSAVVRAAQATITSSGLKYNLAARLAGSWPGVMFTGAPLKLNATHFGLGRGGNAHAPDEWLLIDSSNPAIRGYEGQAVAYVDYLYEIARAARSGKR